MSTATITAIPQCNGNLTVTVSIHDAPTGATWQVLEVWGGPEFFPSSGNDHQATYHAQGTPGATYTLGANVLIGGQRHDADPIQVTIPSECSSVPATTTTTVAQTTTTTVGETTTTVLPQISRGGPTTTTTELAIILPNVDPPVTNVATTVAVRPTLPATGPSGLGMIGGGALGLLVLGVIATRIGKFGKGRR